jgi:hypothetical protein
MKTGLAFRAAQQHVRFYEQEADDVMAEHQEAMDCRDCEAYLQLGIDAFEWLIRADAAFRRGYANNEMEFDEEVALAFQELARLWLRPSARADNWAMTQIAKGFTIGNLDRFRICCKEMQAIVEFHETAPEEAQLPTPLASLRDQALTDYANGKTSEFV